MTRCKYCGTPTKGIACTAHRDLPPRDPKYTPTIRERTA